MVSDSVSSGIDKEIKIIVIYYFFQLYCQLRVVATAVVAMLLGSIFWQIGVHADHMLTNASCLYFFLLFILFSNAMSTVVTCEEDN